MNALFPLRRPSVLAGLLLILGCRPASGETLLFVDDHDILFRSGTRRVLYPFEKYKGNPVIAPENPELPWEKSIQWVSVYKNPTSGKLQIWYQAYSGKTVTDKRMKSVVAYAESADGIHWVKPKLSLFPYQERDFDVKETNIVLVGAENGYGDRYANSVVVNPAEKDPARRYKMTFYDWSTGEGADAVSGLHVAFSPDGIHWTRHPDLLLPMTFGVKGLQPPYEDEAVYRATPNGKGGERRQWAYPMSLSDALDVFWDSRLDRYVIYGKMWYPGPDGGINWKHGMGRSESRDFIHWSTPELVALTGENDPPEMDFHTSPVFLRHGIYFSLNQLYVRENGTIDTELMFSRDGKKWDRSLARKPVIVRGGKTFFDAGFILTNGNPIEMDDEIWFYYGGHHGYVRFPNEDEKEMPRERATRYNSGIGLAKIRKDRFAGIGVDPEASQRYWNPEGEKPKPKENTIGQITLKPRDFSTIGKIRLNARTEEGGSVRLELLNADGYRLRGFAKDDAVPLTGDQLAFEVAFREHSLDQLPPGEILIRIHLDRAEVYALTLEPKE